MKKQIQTILLFLTFSGGCLFGQQLEIHHIDVGQGDATLIIARNSKNKIEKTMLIDAGVKKAGQNKVIPYIRSLPISVIDVIATHYDNDHIGGLTYIMNEAKKTSPVISVSTVYDRGNTVAEPTTRPYSFYKTAASKFGANKKSLAAGDSLCILDADGDGKCFGNLDILLECVAANGIVRVDATSKAKKITAKPNENDLSLAFVLHYGEFRYFTGGDIGGKHGSFTTANDKWDCWNFVDLETPLAEYISHACALSVNHHGSRCSSNDDFLQLLNSKVAIISSGNSSKYKHPRPEVTAALDKVAGMTNYYLTIAATEWAGKWGPTTLPIPGSSARAKMNISNAKAVVFVVKKDNIIKRSKTISIAEQSVFSVGATEYICENGHQ